MNVWVWGAAREILRHCRTAMTKLFSALFCVAVVGIALGGQGCSSDDPPALKDGGTVDPNGNNTICLAVNCDTDRDCADCAEGKTVCYQKEHRCVACGPQGGGRNCPSGQYCTQYGDCVGNGVNCPADTTGTPTGSCTSDNDCAACDPKHRACDTKTSKCVGCTQANKKMCQSTDFCAADGNCKAQCPSECKVDADCGQCGAPGSEAHACFRGECTQCNAQVSCPGGSQCDDHGKCMPSCGDSALDRPDIPGACTKDANCQACTAGTTTCKLPLVGGTGTCAVPAAGCSDLGNGAIKLPAPFDRATNTCSKDGDCAGVSADINVGALLGKLTGIKSIKNGSLKYGMNVCATVKITGTDANCGVCVPCKKDTDCQDIDIQQVAGDILGPIGSIGARILLDQIFGPNDHKIHMYCAKVLGEYGACVPCSNLLSRCAQGEGTPVTTCDHDVCAEGAALAPVATCQNGCAAKVCAEDSFCCTNKWDQTCINRVERLCNPERTCATGDVCRYKSDGYYCSGLQAFSAYKCTGGSIAGSAFCPNNQFCHREAPNGQKSKALMQTATMLQCFTTPNPPSP